VELARHLDEFAERLRGAQHRHVAGNAGLEPRTHQASAGFGRGKLTGIFQIVEKCEVHWTCFVERRQSPDLLAGARSVDQGSFRQRGDIGERRQSGSFKEYRLCHSTRRGPAGDRN